MYKELTDFAARMGALVSRPAAGMSVRHFSERALELFGLQYAHNAAYRQICDARGVTPKNIPSWTQIPAVPTAAFKELDLTCLAPRDRKFVFYSSGTTGARASRHFHNTASMKLYELSLWHWFECHFDARNEFLFLTPPAKLAPNSSLVHMFEIVRKKFGRPPADFTGQIVDKSWAINFPATIEALERACAKEHPVTILGTAFSFVHLLDHLAANKRQFQLPLGSLVMETGGYKNRSRALPKAELHALITKYLAVMEEDIICEYGMSELSSQAYDRAGRFEAWLASERCFRFPHWAVAQIISPETGQEVAVGETGLIRVFDLANVFSVVAVQTEDLGVRRQNGFELVGRAKAAELRGCSLTSI